MYKKKKEPIPANTEHVKFKNVEKNSGNVFIINTNTKGTYTNFFN